MEKDKILAATMAAIEKKHGKGSVMRLDQKGTVKVDVISSGSLGVDSAVGIGGLPRGRIIEVYGPESSGKTTIALQAIAESQKKGGQCAFIDVEHALDIAYATNLGVNCNDLIISQPDHAEAALDIAEALIRSGVIDIIVLDSVAALVPKAELEGDSGDSLPGLQARLMSQALRKLTAMVSKTGTVMIFINQIRMKIGVMFGSPETTTGGNALKFFASLRLDVRKISTIKNKDENIGSRVRVKVVKNKLAPPFRTVEFDILFGKGVNRLGELVDLATSCSIIKKSGSWFSYNDHKLGQGRENVMQFFEENPKIQQEVLERVQIGGPGMPIDNAVSQEQAEE